MDKNDYLKVLNKIMERYIKEANEIFEIRSKENFGELEIVKRRIVKFAVLLEEMFQKHEQLQPPKELEMLHMKVDIFLKSVFLLYLDEHRNLTKPDEEGLSYIERDRESISEQLTNISNEVAEHFG